MNKLLLILIIALIAYFSSILFIRGQGVMCGGFAGKNCPEPQCLFVCQYEGDYPDAAGQCLLIWDLLRFSP